MNDVRIAFDRHEFVDFNSADLGHATDIITAQVDEHDMFGALFGIGQQIGFKLAFFFRRGATAARAGDGAQLNGVAG